MSRYLTADIELHHSGRRDVRAASELDSVALAWSGCVGFELHGAEVVSCGQADIRVQGDGGLCATLIMPARPGHSRLVRLPAGSCRTQAHRGMILNGLDDLLSAS